MTMEKFKRQYISTVMAGLTDQNTSAKSGSIREMSETDAKVILKWLMDKTKVVVTVDSDGKKMVKFGPVDTEKAVLPFTKTDIDILKLVDTRDRVKAQVKALQDRATELDKSVREALQRKQKPVAMTYLKMRKHLDTSVLGSRLSAFDTLEQIISKIQSSASDAEVVNAYELGAETLKAFSKEYGLTAERVDNVLDDLNEALADQNEVDQVLHERVSEVSQPLLAGMDESELELELEQLVEQQEKSVVEPIEKQGPETVKSAEEKKREEEEEEDNLVTSISQLSVSNNEGSKDKDKVLSADELERKNIDDNEEQTEQERQLIPTS